MRWGDQGHDSNGPLHLWGGGGGEVGVGGMIAVYKHQSDLCDVSVFVVAIDRP